MRYYNTTSQEFGLGLPFVGLLHTLVMEKGDEALLPALNLLTNDRYEQINDVYISKENTSFSKKTALRHDIKRKLLYVFDISLIPKDIHQDLSFKYLMGSKDHVSYKAYDLETMLIKESHDNSKQLHKYGSDLFARSTNLTEGYRLTDNNGNVKHSIVSSIVSGFSPEDNNYECYLHEVKENHQTTSVISNSGRDCVTIKNDRETLITTIKNCLPLLYTTPTFSSVFKWNNKQLISAEAIEVFGKTISLKFNYLYNMDGLAKVEVIETTSDVRPGIEDVVKETSYVINF